LVKTEYIKSIVLAYSRRLLNVLHFAEQKMIVGTIVVEYSKI